MVNSGEDLFAVGKALGHAGDLSTQRYSHLANDILLKEVEARRNAVRSNGRP